MRYPLAMHRLIALASLVSILGCSSTVDPGNDAASPADGGSDAFVVGDDTGADDAASATDAAVADTGLGDAAAGSDAGPCMAAGACDPFDPTSCGTMACRPSATGTVCEAVSSTPASLGMPCLHANDCEPGLVCLTFSTADGPICHQMCPAASIGACSAGYVCTGTFGDGCVNVCRPLPLPCDIYAQDCASTTDTCTLVRNAETGMPYTGCRPAGTQDEGMPCGGSAGACGHALICIGTGVGTAACRQVCDSTVTPDTCIAPAACTGLAPTWGVHYCVAP